MKKIILTSLLVVSSSLIAAASSEDLANKHCGSCHLMGKITKEKLNRMSAPPYWALAKKAALKYKTREEQVNYMVDFVLNPTEDKMLFPHETKERFGLMPSQKGIVSKDVILEITNYIIPQEEQ
jgi:hypothetical protein